MRIEAFTEAREPARPETNEDSLVVLPGRAFAVIDGVTDRDGSRFDGMLGGRYAARLVARRLETLLATATPPPESIIPTLTDTLRDACRHHGVDLAGARWGGRMCCTLALVLLDDTDVSVLLVGDSGVRINAEVLQARKDLDTITALLRRAAWHHLTPLLGEGDERERLARQIVFHGTGQPPSDALDQPTLRTLHTRAAAACAAALPHIPADDVAYLLHHGIVHGQGTYQNRTDTVLGYSCLDGSDIPPALIRTARFPRAGVNTIELFSDGYARPAPGFGIAAWEADFATTERLDPSKTGAFLSVKGSTPGRWSDDRTYLGIQLDPP
jgi:hypothetical protein